MKDAKFKLKTKYQASGDQPSAIKDLVSTLNNGIKEQVLLGVTGSGKTFTMASIVSKINRPALVLAHNKTLAAQLYSEFKEFFPNNRVEFFVSYYDYYQPEAYISTTDTYIEKDSSINEEIDKLRHSATASLLERRDVIVIASVSCIYGLGNPSEYLGLQISIRKGDKVSIKEIVKKLVEIQYQRSEDIKRATFNVRGDVLFVNPANSSKKGFRIDFFDDEIESMYEIDLSSFNILNSIEHVSIFPASHYAVESDKLKNVLETIKQDSKKEVLEFKKKNKLIEAQRLQERVAYDIEMMGEMGYCNGIENYSKYFDGRKKGEPPFTLLDYFPDDFLLFVDESHITLPQVRGMYNGDRSRKKTLIEHGFRLDSAFDNRPLNFKEFNEKLGQVIYVSATPSEYELKRSDNVVEQIIRPTGLLDPVIEIKPAKTQVDNLIFEIKKTIKNKGKVLVTALTKKMSESLTDYLLENNIRVRYLHSDIDTLERIDIVQALRKGEFDVIVGINLLREGLDIPEVKLVAILDADKEGFLRSETSLIQTIGRAARNSESKVILYADRQTKSIQKAVSETNRRRKIQENHNRENNIVPTTIMKDVYNNIRITKSANTDKSKLSKKDIIKEVDRLKTIMGITIKNLEFEKSIKIRDEIAELKKILRYKKARENDKKNKNKRR